MNVPEEVTEAAIYKATTAPLSDWSWEEDTDTINIMGSYDTSLIRVWATYEKDVFGNAETLISINETIFIG